MKKMFSLIFFLVFFSINIVYASDLQFVKETNYDVNNIEKTYSSSKEYIIINKNSTLYKYNDQKLLVSKEITNLSNQNIIKYNNKYLLVGISSNTLKIYLLDNNLQIRNQQETSEIVPITTEFKLYSFNNKIYIALTNNNILINNNLIEVDEELNINKKELSSFDPQDLKSVLKADYYLIHHNNEMDGDVFNKYKASTSYNSKNILIGANTLNQAVLKILDDNNETIVKKVFENYQEFKNVEIINDQMYILTDHNIIILDLEGNLVEELNESNVTQLTRLGDKIAFISNENKILFYSYDCNIEIIESDFGTISVSENTKAYDKVKIEIEPNSGYELEKIIVTDKENNELVVKNNEFIMPTTDVTVEAIYTSSVTNPETIDTIFIMLLVGVLSFIFLRVLNKKLNWLK